MEAMEDGVELLTPPTRLPPPLRDTSVSGEAYISFFFSHLFKSSIFLLFMWFCGLGWSKMTVVTCMSPSQHAYGSHRQRAVKNRAAAGQPADQPTDPDAQHGGVYAL